MSGLPPPVTDQYGHFRCPEYLEFELSVGKNLYITGDDNPMELLLTYCSWVERTNFAGKMLPAKVEESFWWLVRISMILWERLHKLLNFQTRRQLCHGEGDQSPNASICAMALSAYSGLVGIPDITRKGPTSCASKFCRARKTLSFRSRL